MQIKKAFKNKDLKIKELMNVITRIVDFKKEQLLELEMALDHVHPEYITWKEFEMWF
jgi:hypothetical protein